MPIHSMSIRNSEQMHSLNSSHIGTQCKTVLIVFVRVSGNKTYCRCKSEFSYNIIPFISWIIIILLRLRIWKFFFAVNLFFWCFFLIFQRLNSVLFVIITIISWGSNCFFRRTWLTKILRSLFVNYCIFLLFINVIVNSRIRTIVVIVWWINWSLSLILLMLLRSAIIPICYNHIIIIQSLWSS